MNSEEHDPLWQLLGRARTPKASPFFARNVLREIRIAQPGGSMEWLRSWRVALPVGAALVVVALSVGLMPHQARHEQNPLAQQIINNPDYDVINHLDELIASEDNSLWLDDSAD